MIARKQLEEFIPDSLFAGSTTNAFIKGVFLKPGQGELKRGSLLYETENGFILYGGADGTTPDCILTDNTQTADEDGVQIYATAYQTGEFAAQKIITADGYEITDKDRTELRKLGIFLVNIMEKF